MWVEYGFGGEGMRGDLWCMVRHLESKNQEPRHKTEDIRLKTSVVFCSSIVHVSNLTIKQFSNFPYSIEVRYNQDIRPLSFYIAVYNW